MFVNKTLFRFFFVSASENGAKIELVSLLFQKCRFYENLQKTLKKQWFLSIFQVSSFQKSTKNRCRNAFEKKIAKKHPKNRFGAPFWLPKTSQNRSKIEPGRQKWEPRTKLVSRRYGNHPRVVANQRGLRPLDCENGFAYD